MVRPQATPPIRTPTTHTEYEAFQPVLLHYQFDDVIAFLQELQVLSLEQRLIQRDTVALRHNLSQTVAKSIIANIENFKFFKTLEPRWSDFDPIGEHCFDINETDSIHTEIREIQEQILINYKCAIS